jgi:hypothetical protein
MKTFRWAAIAAVLGMILLMIAAWLSPPAHAQAVACGQADEILAAIVGKYGEQPAAVGSTAGQAWPMTIYANPKTGTWTAVFFTPNGGACIFGAGEHFELKPIGEAT